MTPSPVVTRPGGVLCECACGTVNDFPDLLVGHVLAARVGSTVPSLLSIARKFRQPLIDTVDKVSRLSGMALARVVGIPLDVPRTNLTKKNDPSTSPTRLLHYDEPI